MTSIIGIRVHERSRFVAALMTAMLFLQTAGMVAVADDAPRPKPVAGGLSEPEVLKLQLAGKTEAMAIDLFDRTVFGGKGPQAVQDARERLDRFLQRRLRSIERICGLADGQKEKLELAGRGDIKRFWGRVETQREKLVSARNEDDLAVFTESSRELKALRRACRSGPFDEESLFVKTLKNVLTPEQAAKLSDQRLKPESKTKITVENAADLTRTRSVEKNVCGVTWNRAGDQVALTDFGNSVEIYSFPEYKLLRTIGERRKPVGFDFSATDNVVAIAENSKNAAIINLLTGRELLLETGNSQPSVKFSPDGKRLATGGYGKTARLWSTETGRMEMELDVGVEGGLTPAFSPDGSILAIGNRNSTTHLFEVATGRLKFVLGKSMSHGLKFDPTGATLAVVYVDSSIGLWDAKTGRMIDHVQNIADELYTLDWTPDGTVLATGGNNASITLWDASDLSILNELPSPEWVIKVCFSPDGTKLLTAGGGRPAGAERYVETWAVP